MAQERLNVVLQMITSNFKSEARGVSGSLNRMRGDFQHTDKSARMLEQGFSRVGKMAGLAIAGAAAGAVAVFTREMIQSVKAFAEFDQKMTQSLAIMGDVSESMRGDMSDAAREVGRTTLFSASQAAEAYFFLASAGLSAQQSIEAMPQVAQFAQAGMFDLARATDLLTDAQSALGLKSASAQTNLMNMARVSDVLVKANILANASVEQFSEALTTKAGAALRALGKDVEEGAAVLAAYADQGLKGAEAGTQFSIVLRDLTTKALQNKMAFEEAGIAVFDASGDMRNMADIIADLEGALGGLSDASQKQRLLDLGFSDKSLASLTTLLGTSDDIRRYEAALRSAGGVTREVADNQLESLAGQFELVKSKINDTRIEVGEEMAPALRDLIPEIEAAVDQLGEFAVAAGPQVASAISGLITLLEGAQEAFFDFQAAWQTTLFELGNIPGTNFSFFGDRDSATAARQKAELIELMSSIRRAGKGSLGSNPAEQLATALVVLEGEAAVTQDAIEALGRTFEASDEQILDALETYLMWMDVNKEDVSTEQLEKWIREVEDAIRVADILDRDTDLADTLATWGQAAEDGTPGVEDFGEAIAETADDADDLATALERAAAAQESLADQILRFTDPIFNATAAISDLATAEEELAELRADPEATPQQVAQAKLDIARARGEAEAAMEALRHGGEDAIDALALLFTGPKTELLEILDTLGLIEDGDWGTVFDIELRLMNKQILDDLDRLDDDFADAFDAWRRGGGAGRQALESIEGAQHQGGPVEAGKRYPVLRNEIFVPSQDGMVIPAGAGGGDNYVINVSVPPGQSKDIPASVAREIERALDRRTREVS